jgi:hypothetical protein
MIRRLLLLSLLVSVLSETTNSAPSDAETTVRNYLAARDRKTALTYIAPDFRLWFDSRTGLGLKKAELAKMLEWDFELRPRHIVRDLRVNGREVTVTITKQNDFSRLLDFPGWNSISTFVVDDSGRIVNQLFVRRHKEADLDPYLEKALPWLEENRPEVLKEIYPDNKLNQTADSAQKWVQVLRDWRAATNRPDPTQQ